MIENEWSGTPLICIGDYLNPDDLPASIQHNNLHLTSNQGNVISKPLRYDVVQESFDFWSYAEEGENAATITAMAASVGFKNRVLRNLTTCQYILEDKLPSGITIGHIVLMRICWSSDGSTGITGGEYLDRGDWAGHKFDIVDTGLLKNLNGEWENVTEDILDEVEDLWSSEFGQSWETEWMT